MKARRVSQGLFLIGPRCDLVKSLEFSGGYFHIAHSLKAHVRTVDQSSFRGQGRLGAAVSMQ